MKNGNSDDLAGRDTAMAFESRVCISCKNPAATIICSCALVWYCSNAWTCQTPEWPEHNKTCNPSAKILSKPSPVVPSSKGKNRGGNSEAKSGSALCSVN